MLISGCACLSFFLSLTFLLVSLTHSVHLYLCLSNAVSSLSDPLSCLPSFVHLSLPVSVSPLISISSTTGQSVSPLPLVLLSLPVCPFVYQFASPCLSVFLSVHLSLSLPVFAFLSFSLLCSVNKLSLCITLILPTSCLSLTPLLFLTHYLLLVQSLLLTLHAFFHRIESYCYLLYLGCHRSTNGKFKFLREIQHYLTSVGSAR